jgi:outer membrane protein with beta-barrel domain
MNKLFATALLILGSVCAAQAQGTDGNDPSNGTPDLLAAAAPKVSIFAPSGPFFLRPAKPVSAPDAAVVPTALAVPADPADPAAPPAKPKFLYSRNDIVRWELGFGVNWIRFRSSIFNASAVGVKTSLTYFTNEWFGIEGNVSAAFAPEIFDREHVKLLVYGIGPKIAWRERKWEPWMHALVGGAHEQPQTAGNTRNAFSVQAGGGVDYNINARFAGRLEGNYIRTTFFNQSQNNFQLGAGIVVHF